MCGISKRNDDIEILSIIRFLFASFLSSFHAYERWILFVGCWNSTSRYVGVEFDLIFRFRGEKYDWDVNWQFFF